MTTPETSEIKHCIYDVNKHCGYPDKLVTGQTPNVFIISSSECQNTIEWVKNVFEKNVRTDDDSKFEVIYFTDKGTRDFCNNVCIPIHEAWFCIAVIKEELLPVIAKRKKSEIITSYISRLNPNVFFEVGLALALHKGVILYKGKNQEIPSDWKNLFKLVISEPSLFLSSTDNASLNEQLEKIVRLNPFIPKSIKWINDKK